jgi:hypothetical protein
MPHSHVLNFQHQKHKSLKKTSFKALTKAYHYKLNNGIVIESIII